MYGDEIEYRSTKYPALSREKLKELYYNINEDILGQDMCKNILLAVCTDLLQIQVINQ